MVVADDGVVEPGAINVFETAVTGGRGDGASNTIDQAARRTAIHTGGKVLTEINADGTSEIGSVGEKVDRIVLISSARVNTVGVSSTI